MTSIEKKTAQAIDKLFYEAFSGTGEVGAPNPKFKPSYTSPEATAKVLVEAIRTQNAKLAMSCVSEAAAKKMLADMPADFKDVLGAEGFEDLVGMFMLPLLKGYTLGQLISESPEKRVYEYATDMGPGESPQTFVKVGAKWLMAD